MGTDWAHKVVKTQIIVVIVLAVAAASLFGWSWAAHEGILGAVRDVGIAEYAHLRAGPPIPVDPKVVDYEEAMSLMPEQTWSIVTNSQWLADIVRRIVPYYYYVDISRPATYPIGIFFEPMGDEANFHLLGQEMSGQDIWGNVGPVVQLNERMVDGDASDMRVLLTTIVHEDIHGQGGDFINPAHCPEPKDPNNPTPDEIACWTGESPALESNTQTATLEVLASYCNHQDDLACRTFWFEVEDASASSFEVWTWDHKIGWLYDWIDKTLWLSPGQVPQFDASMRYWANNCPECLTAIVTKYGAMVWQKTLLGVVNDQTMPTGIADQSKDPTGSHPETVTTKNPDGSTTTTSVIVEEYPECQMVFDDEHYVLGPVLIMWLRLLSWGGL